ncbi:MAG: 5-amino-6-(D-ribitylamino)uracil--L-tyrosine 4-hydroxyphenyl transferase CofH [Gammaproteobacteria bacterium]|nr:5-amino-6-(D-ribitylamino)uracil--L-tyrosine 4-hydroxyphenyl transferase CofH [Gammaproteobacteria bacterium]
MIIQTAAVVPVKQLSRVKQRLSTLLNEQERADLFQAMLQDVLNSLQRCQHIDAIYIVTSDSSLEQLANKFDAEIIVESEPSDLNHAAATAGKLLSDNGISRMLLVPGDLPLLRASELDKVLSFTSENSLTIVPSQDLEGSNCLVCTPPDCLPFSFGEQSFNRHLQLANNLHLKTKVAHLPGIGLDIDTEADLITLVNKLACSSNSDTYTGQYLKNSGLFDRLKKIDNNALLALKEIMPHGPNTWSMPDHGQSLGLSRINDTEKLMAMASSIRDEGHGQVVSFSKKVFIPLTQLCRDVCHYCTFAQTPKKLQSPYLKPEQLIEIARKGAEAGCKEVLFTLGDKPEARYPLAQKWLTENGYASTIDYLEDMARTVFRETGLIPHLNPGLMSADELGRLKQVSASMGIMLESASDRLTEKGMPHYGSPDKIPARRIETIRLAGEQGIAFTSGILIGLGETRTERIEALLILRDLHQQYSHIQEIIIQNFRAKPGTKMSHVDEPDLNELLWTIAIARIIFGPAMNIQAPPNLSPGVLPKLVQAGINDWGGVSPVTPDFVNPEAPWPHLEKLAKETLAGGKALTERLTIYPEFALNASKWTSPEVSTSILRAIDGSGFARDDEWSAGSSTQVPQSQLNLIKSTPSSSPSQALKDIFYKVENTQDLDEKDITHLLKARGNDFSHVCQTANSLRKSINGEEVTFVINRNINYTNICSFKCSFCAFSKGKTHEKLRGKPYNIDCREIASRTEDAWKRGATEVCLQGGIHPEYTGETYLDICQAIKETVPDIHIHAFSPLEIWQGASTLGLSLSDYLKQLKMAGLSTLPGTAAEILDDEIRAIICPDKISTQQWLQVMEVAHGLGIKTTATLMFGHTETYQHIARHLLRIRELQKITGGFTEFVPLPFVHMEAPIYRRGQARKGPSFREAMLVHAVSRLVLHPHIKNIQASWPKLGHAGVSASLYAGVNDLGGTLMNESITRAAGASHGQETSPEIMRKLILSAGRTPRQRTTAYALLDEKELTHLPRTSKPSRATESINNSKKIVIHQAF